MDPYRQSDASLATFSILNSNAINLMNSNPSPQHVLPPNSNSSANTSNNSDASTNKPTHTNTFVHKLFNMVLDDQYQHLIAWSYTGSSFIVCNIMDFSKDVLPKHFKHNNFSSFVRQLNMYGFHKVNKSPRGHRTLAENQIWEFSHAKFLRNRADLLDDIKRKAMDTDTTRSQGDIQTHLTMLQMSQSDMIQQINHLFDKFNQVVKELTEAKKQQASQSLIIKQLAALISHQNGGQLPVELNLEGLSLEGNSNSTSSSSTNKDHHTPSIFVTSHESSPIPTNITPPSNTFEVVSSTETYNYQHHHHSFSPVPSAVGMQGSPPRSPHYQAPHQQYSNPQTSMAGHSPLSTTFTTSLSSTPTGLMASDDDASLYSPHTPTDSNHARSNAFQQLHHHCK